MATTRWGGLRLEPYNPNAVDADGDGIVQEGTAWERPGGTRLIDELGREIRTGITSAQRPPKMRVQRDGKDVDYTPTYGTGAPTPEAPEGKPTALAKAGAPSLKEMGLPTLKSMLGTLGEPVSTQITPQEVQQGWDIVGRVDRRLVGQLSRQDLIEASNFQRMLKKALTKVDEPEERLRISNILFNSFYWGTVAFNSSGGSIGAVINDIWYSAQDAGFSPHEVLEEMWRAGGAFALTIPMMRAKEKFKLTKKQMGEFASSVREHMRRKQIQAGQFSEKFKNSIRSVFQSLKEDNDVPGVDFDFNDAMSAINFANNPSVMPTLASQLTSGAPGFFEVPEPSSEINFEDFDELLSMRKEVGRIEQESLAGLVGTTWFDWVTKLDVTDDDGKPIHMRNYPLSDVSVEQWSERVEAEIRGNRSLNDVEKERALQNLSDLLASEELRSIHPWLTEAKLTSSDPFADSRPTAPYPPEEARRRYSEAFRKLSQTQRDKAIEGMMAGRQERQVQDAEKQAIRIITAERTEEAQRMILPVPINTRDHQPSPGQALDGQRSKNASEFKSDSTKPRDVETIQSQADQVLAKAGDLSDAIHEQELIDLMLDREFTGNLDDFSTFPNSQGSDFIRRFIARRGFDGDVLTVLDSELDDMLYSGYKEISRGGSKEPNDKFLNGEMLIGNGIDGAGLYFASVTFRPNSQMEVIPHFRAEEYARSAPDGGSVIRGVINPSSRKISIFRIRKEVDAYRAHRDGAEPEINDSPLYALRERLTEKAKTDSQASDALKTLDVLILSPYGEPNHAIGVSALLMGYDAITDPPESNRTLLYNRTAVVMSEDVNSPDEFEQIMGYENFRNRQNAKLIAQGKLPLDPTPEQYEEWRRKRIAEIVSEGVVSAEALEEASVVTQPAQNMNPDEL